MAKMGRPKGATSARSNRFKVSLNKLLERSSDHMLQWLNEVAKDDPKGALDCVTKLAEYVYPKIQRTEHVGKDGEQLSINHILQAIETPVIPEIEAQPIDAEYEILMNHGVTEDI